MSPFSGDVVEAKYETLEEAHLMDDIADSEADLPLPRRQSRVAKLTTVVPWTISAVLLVLLGASWAFKWSEECGSSSFERGFSTELGKSQPPREELRDTESTDVLSLGETNLAERQGRQNPRFKCTKFVIVEHQSSVTVAKSTSNMNQVRPDTSAIRAMRSMKRGMS